MRKNYHKIESSKVPVVFTDGSKVYEELAKEYIRHDSGLFILAPSGTGKTYFVESQVDKNWIDGDVVWPLTGADFSDDDWNFSPMQVDEINARCDVVTHELRKLGFWVMGSSNKFLKPDAIVIPEWEQHIAMVQKREDSDKFDGGAKPKDHANLKNHIESIKKKWPKEKVPYFKSIEAAVDFLSK